jgi:hypothetical protein
MSDNGAVQVNTTAAKVTLPAQTRRVTIQNLGPNAIYLAATAAKCTTALGLQVPATTGIVTIDIANDELYAIAATALQVSPADTRFYVLGP